MRIDKLSEAQKQKMQQEKLGNLCLQHGITEVDLFRLIKEKKARNDKSWTD